MKKLIVLIFILSILYINASAQIKVNLQHKDFWGNTHVHIVEQAKNFMFWKKGLNYSEILNNLWEIQRGDLDEDEFDAVYHYDDIAGASVTVTHFWNADEGDNQENCFNVCGVFDVCNVPNALTKATKFIHGNYLLDITDDNEISHRFEYPDTPWGEPGLVNYYKHGYVYCWKKYPNGTVHGWETHSEHVRTSVTFQILGHICHLLQDMSMPVHAHAEIHPSDDFEVFAGLYALPDYRTAGEFLDPFNLQYGPFPIRGLFYTANQIADLIPCHGEGVCSEYTIYGDNSFPNGTNDVLSDYYSRIFNNQGYHQIWDLNEQKNILVNYSINATASLLYWFGETAGLTKVYAPNISNYSSNMIGNSTIGYELFKGQYGYISPITSGSTASPTWHCYECDNSGEITPWPFTVQHVTSVSLPNWPYLLLQNESFTGLPCNSIMNGAGPTSASIQARLNLNFYNYNVWTGRMIVRPHVEEAPGGCPFIFVLGSDTSGGKFFIENNILHRSEFNENTGNNITDYYKINTVPKIDSGKINIQIMETENDINYFDQMKLYAVDHPEGTKIGITESNDIVMYYSSDATSTDNAILNTPGNNITTYVQYGQSSPKVRGVSNDYIYAHYDSTAQKNKISQYNKRAKMNGKGTIDSLALIGQIGSNDAPGIGIGNPAKDWAGNISIITNIDTYTKPFSKRVLVSDVIIPYAQSSDNVDHIEINCNSDYAMNYFALIPVSYDGYTKTEMTLAEATHSTQGNVWEILKDLDNNIVMMDSTAIVDLKFNYSAPQDPSLKRDYVFVVNGKYTAVNNTTKKSHMNPMTNNNLNPNNITYKYKLNSNYPNPFNPVTKINYELEKPGYTKLEVFDVLGRLVDVLVKEYKQAGNYTLDFNGSRLSSGVYFYKLQSNDFVDIKRMVLIK